jgi:hypothetical protein
MTLRGKRKALRNDPAAQIAAIKEAFKGIVPTQPLARRYPRVAWPVGDSFHIAKLISGKLYVKTSMEKPGTVGLFRNPLEVSGYLSKTYFKRVGIPDLQAALTSPVVVPTLEESQLAVVCWVNGVGKTLDTTPPEYKYCCIMPDGILSGKYRGIPKMPEDYCGPVIKVMNLGSAIEFIRRVFKLDIGFQSLEQSQGKTVKIHKIEAKIIK